MYSSEIRTFTIIECAIVPNIHHITLTRPLIYGLYSAANVIHTQRIEIPS